mmetsp:Transcript_3371/g.7654  ORF Transcript_3371/g.7654 Transcript_3371/m.7654 type:complete len:82 (+) Transcript_3371:2526-2771(+)
MSLYELFEFPYQLPQSTKEKPTQELEQIETPDSVLQQKYKTSRQSCPIGFETFCTKTKGANGCLIVQWKKTAEVKVKAYTE